MKKFCLPLLCAFLLSCAPAPSSSTSEKPSETTAESTSSSSEESPSTSSSTITMEEESSSSETSEHSSEEESEPSEYSDEESASGEYSSEESSESSIETSEDSPIESSGEEPIETSSEEPIEESTEEPVEEYYHEFILDENNGKISGSYSSSETVNDSGKDDNGNPFKIGYKMCMGSTNSSYGYAQMKKNEGVLYSISSLGELKAITVTLSSSGNMKLEVTKGQNDSYTLSTALKSNETLGVPSGYTHFRLTAGSSAAYIKSISLVYSSSDIEILPPSEDASSSSGTIETGTGDITLPPIDPTDTTSYYEDIGANTSGKELKTELCHLIDGHTNKGYDYAYTAYQTTDVDADNKIIDMYSAYRFDPTTDHQGAPGKSNYNAEGQMFNREHTIPQSVFSEGSPMKSDLHHLLPTDAYVNNKRGNLPHAEVNNVTYTSTNGTKIGTSTVQGYSGSACEVPDQYKGDFARIYFYMVTRYEENLPKWKSYACFDKQSFPGLSSWAIDLYLRWSDEDPVSDKEIIRNEEIAKIQLNRNPFIDHPEYAHRIWDNA